MLSHSQHVFILNSVFDTLHGAIIWILCSVLVHLILFLFFIIWIVFSTFISFYLLLDFLHFHVSWASNFSILKAVAFVAFDWWRNVSLRSCFSKINLSSWVCFLNLKIYLFRTTVWSYGFSNDLITVLLCSQPGLLIFVILIVFIVNILFNSSYKSCTWTLSIRLFSVDISIVWFITNILHIFSPFCIWLITAWIFLLSLLIFSDPIISDLFRWLGVQLVLFICWLNAETNVNVHLWWVSRIVVCWYWSWRYDLIISYSFSWSNPTSACCLSECTFSWLSFKYLIILSLNAFLIHCLLLNIFKKFHFKILQFQYFIFLTCSLLLLILELRQV